MITLDASLVIAHLNASDAHHAQATSFLRERAGGALIMHALNLAEVLVGGARVGRAPELAADLRAIGVEVAGRTDDEPLRLALLRAETGLKLPDCCALDAAMTTGSMLATFDARLATAARDRRLSVGP